jgi:chitodextrinase
MQLQVSGNTFIGAYKGSTLFNVTDSSWRTGSWGLGFYPEDIGSGPPALTDAGFNQVTTTEVVNTFTDTNLQASTSYSYRVQATDAAGNLSSYSSIVSVTTPATVSVTTPATPGPDTTAPSIPTGLSATVVSSSQINLSWSASTDPDNAPGQLSYRVYRNSVQIGTTAAGTTSFSDTGLAASTTYTYTVSAQDPAGNASAPSSGIQVTAQAPVPTISSFNANASSITNGQRTTLSWVVSNATSLTLDNGIGSVTGTSSITVSPSATTVYTLTATNSSGSTTAQTTVTVTPGTTPPTAPTNLTAVTASSSQINLNWTASTDNVGVTAYYVERCSGAGCSNFAQIGSSVPKTYSSNFPLTENPISQGGQWTNGLTNGLDWSDCQTNGTMVYGGATAPQFKDSLCIQNQTWRPDMSINATVQVNVSGGIQSYETEIRARSTLGAHVDTGYEFNVNTKSQNPYWSFVNIGVPANSYTILASGLLGSAPATGDVMQLQVSGNTFIGSYKGSTLFNVTDSSWPTGSWGLGFYPEDIGSGPPALTDAGFNQVTTTEVGNTFTDTNLQASTSYSYRVRATDAAGNLSSYSSIVSVTTPATTNSSGSTTAQTSVTVTPDTTPPTAPTNLTAVTASSSQINLSWTTSTDNLGVSGYSIYRNGALLTTTTLTTYTDTGLTVSTTYTYTVSAFDAAGNTSSPSNSATATTSSAGGPRSPYTTNFPVTENPISEGGSWLNGKTNGLDWSGVRTTRGLAFGTQSGSNGYDDSIAVLTGTWGPDQTVQATVHSVNQNLNYYEEVELHLRKTITPHSSTGYEINFRCTGSLGQGYMSIVRWNGPVGNSFTFVNFSGPGANGVKDGDVVKANITGSTITVWLNGVEIAQGTDSTYTSGNPGIGFYLQGGPSSADSDFGFTNFTASNGSSTVDTNPPTVPANLSGIATSPSQINLSWTASTDDVGVTGYDIFRNGNLVATIAPTTFADTGLIPNTLYNYTVAAFDAAGNVSAQSAPVSVTTPLPDVIPPSTPTGLQASNVASSSVTVTWASSTDNLAVAGYQIFRNGVQIGSTTGTSYGDSGLSPSTTYAYTVAAFDTSNNVSPQSQQLFVTTAAAPAIPPSFVQVSENQISSGASISASFNVATTTGNTIIVVVSWSNNSPVSVTDSQGDTFVSVSPATSWWNGYSAQVFYATNVAGGATTVTASFGTSVSFFGTLYANEYAGINAANPIDATASASGASSLLNSGNITTTSANDLIFGAGVSDNSVTAAGTGFTARDLAYGNIMEDQTGSTPGLYSATATHNGIQWEMQVVAFRAAK